MRGLWQWSTHSRRVCLSESKAQHTHIHRPVALKDDVAFECERSKLRTSDFTTVTRSGFGIYVCTYVQRTLHLNAVNDLQQPDFSGKRSSLHCNGLLVLASCHQLVWCGWERILIGSNRKLYMTNQLAVTNSQTPAATAPATIYMSCLQSRSQTSPNHAIRCVLKLSYKACLSNLLPTH